MTKPQPQHAPPNEYPNHPGPKCDCLLCEMRRAFGVGKKDDANVRRGA